MKSLTCTIGPSTAERKASVKVSLTGGVLHYQNSNPNFDADDMSKAALNEEPTFSKVREKRRSWELYNDEIPRAATRVKTACGEDFKLELDLSSWQKGGYGITYPDLDIAGVCASYAEGIVSACEEDKAALRARLDGIRCGFLGKGHENDVAQLRYDGKTLVVGSGTTSSGQNGVRVRDDLKKPAAPASRAKAKGRN